MAVSGIAASASASASRSAWRNPALAHQALGELRLRGAVRAALDLLFALGQLGLALVQRRRAVALFVRGHGFLLLWRLLAHRRLRVVVRRARALDLPLREDFVRGFEIFFLDQPVAESAEQAIGRLPLPPLVERELDLHRRLAVRELRGLEPLDDRGRRAEESHVAQIPPVAVGAEGVALGAGGVERHRDPAVAPAPHLLGELRVHLPRRGVQPLAVRPQAADPAERRVVGARVADHDRRLVEVRVVVAGDLPQRLGRPLAAAVAAGAQDVDVGMRGHLTPHCPRQSGRGLRQPASVGSGAPPLVVGALVDPDALAAPPLLGARRRAVPASAVVGPVAPAADPAGAFLVESAHASAST